MIRKATPAPPTYLAGAPAEDVLTDLYWAAVTAVSPHRAMTDALTAIKPDLARPLWLVAIGKAANQMAIAAVDYLARRRVSPMGGIVIVPRAVPPPHPALAMYVGDHPIPGSGSFEAAVALERVVGQIAPSDEVWVLLSGGATSLAAAPLGAVRVEELAELFTLLLHAGLDILAMNMVRKRFIRWGAGRLATALEGSRVRNFVISDVIGDDLGAIGSGPCTPDVTTAAQVRSTLEDARLWDRLPLTARRYVLAAERGGDAGLETPKPGHRAFVNVERRIVGSNRQALDAALARAHEIGLGARIIGSPLTGDAAATGRRLALQLLSEARRPASGRRCLIWGGETTVRLEPGHVGPGGRCQELALACAGELHRSGQRANVALLAAGTDGRDGDSDAAGAVVDASTWARVIAAGRDPARDLTDHRSHDSLGAAGALLRTDLTGTNVMDIAIGLCGA